MTPAQGADDTVLASGVPAIPTTIVATGSGIPLQAPTRRISGRLAAPNAGVLDTQIKFSNIPVLIGGSGTDDFQMAGTGSIGSINGGAGLDTLDFSQYPTPATIAILGKGSVDGVYGSATGIATTFNNINTIVGNAGATLTGSAKGGTFTYVPSLVDLAADLAQGIAAGATNFGIQADPTQPGSLTTILNAINGLAAPAAPVTITVYLDGGTYTDQTAMPPANVNVVVANGTIVGGSPALVVNASSGHVELDNVTLTDTTNSPTIIVNGGTLIMRADVIKGLGTSTQPLLEITGGLVDLGTSSTAGTANYGGNTFNGNALLIDNTGVNDVYALGNTFEHDGAILATPAAVRQRIADGSTVSGSGLVILQASVLTVTSAADSASPSDPAGTLRWAVNQANQDADNGSPDTIVFDTAQMGTKTITLRQGVLQLEQVTIDGGGQVTINGANQSEVFEVDGNAAATLLGLTIANGLGPTAAERATTSPATCSARHSPTTSRPMAAASPTSAR